MHDAEQRRRRADADRQRRDRAEREQRRPEEDAESVLQVRDHAAQLRPSPLLGAALSPADGRLPSSTRPATAFSRTCESGSLSALVSAGTARASPLAPSAIAAFSRTCASLSAIAVSSGSMILGSRRKA